MADRSISLNSTAAAAGAPGCNWHGRLQAIPSGSSIRSRLLHGLAWAAVGSVVAQGGSFLSSVVMARILGRETFGRLALIQGTAVALTSMAGLGLGVTATKYVSEYWLAEPDRVGRILGLCSAVAILAAFCISVAILVFASSVAPGGDPSVVWGLRVCAIYVFFISLNGYQIGAMAGFEEFRAMALINVAYGIASLLLSWALTVWLGFRGAVLAQPAGGVVLWALYQRRLVRQCSARRIRIRYRGAWDERAILMRFSIPSATGGILMTAAMWWCNIDLARVSGYAELALFSAVNNLRSMILFVPSLVGRVACPCLNRLLAGRDLAAFRRTFRDTVLTNGGIAMVLALVLSAAGPRILGVFGKDFVGSPLLFVLFLGSVFLEVVATTLFQALFTTGKIWLNVAIVTIWASVLVGCMLAAAPRFGALGIAFSYLCAWCVSLVLYAAAARKQFSRLEPCR
jgi:O-antigen/teichoic acid export membrane protein